MRKIPLILLALFLHATAQAQDKPVNAHIEISAFTVTNNRGQTPDNIGLGIAGGVNLFRRLYLGAEAFGDHDDPGGAKTRVRTRYFGTFQFYEIGPLNLSVGGGGGKTGNEAFGFGQLGVRIPALAGLDVFGRYGNQDAVEADGSVALLDSDNWAFRGFYRYSKIKIANLDSEQQIAGVRLVIK